MTKLIIKDFECIPLQTLHNETCATLADDEIFYSDEFGNYVFPIVHQEPGSCSCPHRYDISPRDIQLITLQPFQWNSSS